MTQTAYLPEIATLRDPKGPPAAAGRCPIPAGGQAPRSPNAAPYSWAMLEYVREGLAIQEHLRFDTIAPLDAAELRALLSSTHNRRCRDMVTGRRRTEEEILVDRLLATVAAG